MAGCALNVATSDFELDLLTDSLGAKVSSKWGCFVAGLICFELLASELTVAVLQVHVAAINGVVVELDFAAVRLVYYVVAVAPIAVAS